MKYYFIKSINLPFDREWNIYNGWISSDRNLLIERVRKYLESEVLLKSTTLTEVDGWLLVNDNLEKWLFVGELEVIS